METNINVNIRSFYLTVRVLVALFVSLLTIRVSAQEKSLKEQALDEFSKEHYSEAVALMEKALSESPDDAEILPPNKANNKFFKIVIK